jgi:hypothetical protein
MPNDAMQPSPWQRRRAAAAIILLAAFFVYWRLYPAPHVQLKPPVQLKQSTTDWLTLLLGAGLILMTISDLRTGKTFIRYRPGVTRADNPVLYWSAVVWHLVVAVAVGIFSLRDLLGL